MAKVTLTVNGRKMSGDCEDRTLLVHFIREKLGLTGTHVGCDTSQCGACVVHLDGKAVKSCTTLAVAVDVISKRRGGPSIIGLLMRRRDRSTELITDVPAVIPTSGTNESSQPADLPKV